MTKEERQNRFRQLVEKGRAKNEAALSAADHYQALVRDGKMSLSDAILFGFAEGVDWSQRQPWHEGREIPSGEDGDLYLVIPSVTCDWPLYRCYYNPSEEEPFSCHEIRLAHKEVALWARLDDIVPDIKKIY